MEGRKTNVDIEALAASPLVRQFMHRVLVEETDAPTSHVFAINLAQRAADAFDLYDEGGRAFARALIAVAAEVITEARALDGAAR